MFENGIVSNEFDELVEVLIDADPDETLSLSFIHQLAEAVLNAGWQNTSESYDIQRGPKSAFIETENIYY